MRIRYGCAVVLVLCAGLFFGCNGGNSAGSADTQAQTGARPESSGGTAPRPTGGNGANGSAVRTAKVESRTRTVLAGGRLQPATRIQHSVPVAGLVRSVAVRPGMRVAAGTTLFTVERNEVGQTFLPVPVTARLAGTVAAVDVVENAEVKSGDSGVVIVGSNGYVLEAAISDRDASGVGVGQAVRATAPDGSVQTGRLVERSQEPDYTTGLFRLRFEFPATQKSYIGQFLLVEVPTESSRGIFVPREAIARRYGRYFAWVVGDDGKLMRREVTLGETAGDELRIASGLGTGDRYLARTTGREREGAPAPGSR